VVGPIPTKYGGTNNKPQGKNISQQYATLRLAASYGKI